MMTKEDIKKYLENKPRNYYLREYDLNEKVEEFADFYNYLQRQDNCDIMKTYLFRFDTNYGTAGIIITTAKGLDYAKKLADERGAWDFNDITIIDTKTDGFIDFVNFGE